MKRLILALTLAMLLSTIALAPAQAVESDRFYALDDENNHSVTWTNDLGAGVAPTFFTQDFVGDYECVDAGHNCDYTHITVRGLTYTEIGDGQDDRVNVQVWIAPDVAVGDMDLIVWESDVDGNKGSIVDSSGDIDLDPMDEGLSWNFNATPDEPLRHYLIEVVYFAAAGTYEGSIMVI